MLIDYIIEFDRNFICDDNNRNNHDSIKKYWKLKQNKMSKMLTRAEIFIRENSFEIAISIETLNHQTTTVLTRK